MTDYTIITTEGDFEVSADRFVRDPDGDLYCYDDDGEDPVGHVDSERFVGIIETEHYHPTLT